MTLASGDDGPPARRRPVRAGQGRRRCPSGRANSNDDPDRRPLARRTRQRQASLRWVGTDPYPHLTWLAVMGAVAAGALALWGLPPVDLHGPLHRLGIMDPLCGGTRAAYFAVTGQWSKAWLYNPLGPLAVIGAAAVALRATLGFAAHRWLVVDLVVSRRTTRLACALGVLAALALGVRQQLLVDLLL